MKNINGKGKLRLPRMISNDYGVRKVFAVTEVRRVTVHRKSVKLKDLPKKDVMDMLVGVDRHWWDGVLHGK